MNSPLRRAAALLLAAVAVLLLAGCTTQAPPDSSIPWNQPADWEGQIPGMTGSGSNVH
jgi:outer membrane biogenesis lipoprotein LolB